MIDLKEKTIAFAKYISIGMSSALSYEDELGQKITISFDEVSMLKRKHRINPVTSGVGKTKR